MKKSQGKAKAIEVVDYRPEDAADFLGLTDEEREIVDLRVALAMSVRRLRASAGLSQREAAARMKTSQPRFNRIESGGPGISLDLMFRAFFTLGGTLADLAAPIPSPRPKPVGDQESNRRVKRVTQLA